MNPDDPQGMFGSVDPLPIDVQDSFNPAFSFIKPKPNLADLNSYSASPVLSGGGMDVMATLKKYAHIPTHMRTSASWGRMA